LRELNETWNHGDLRRERQKYLIQQVCVLQSTGDPSSRDVTDWPRRQGVT
jgi:hypothetical protein